MDVKQLAFLARQPSAELKARESFWGMPKRGIALILANAMFWQPLMVQAEGIVVSGGGASLTTAGNGVQVINIAKPNGSGLSHNTFDQYNVGSQGVILNNATSNTQKTQLGGIIIGNSNLKGTAATTILNEVTGNNRTQLKGYTEVAGQAARVIIANPYGITCNGCGFINTPQATLTTGKPVLEQGRLDHFKVDGGDISIEGAGLNASNIEQFDLITRSAKLNAKLYAKKLNVVTGRNNVDARTLEAAALADDGSVKPELAIDSSALGGMYAGSIKLVGTEQGVGVKLNGELAASAGDVTIDANGKLTMATAAATGAVTVKARSLEATDALYAGTDLSITTQDDLFNQKSIAAGGKVLLATNGQLTNLGAIEAGVNADNTRNAKGDVQIDARSVRNSGQVIATRDLRVTAEQDFDNRSGKLIGGQVTATATRIDNRKGLIGGNASSASIIVSERLDNSEGTVQAETDLVISGGDVVNQKGTLLGKTVTVTGNSLDNSQQGSIIADSGALKVTVEQAVNNQQGRLQSTVADIALTVGSLDNQLGVIVGEKVAVTTTFEGLDNRGGQVLGTRLDVDAKTLIDNRDAGQLVGGSDGLKLTAQQIQNQQGTILAGGSDAELDLGQGRLDNQAGSISASSISLTAGDADNSGGTLTSLDGNLQLTVERLTNQGGLIEASQKLLLDGQSFDNSAGGRLIAYLGDLSRITLQGDLDNRNGRIAIGSQAFSLQADTLLNSGGKIEHAATGQFSLRSASLQGAQGQMVGLGAGDWNVANVDGTGLWHVNGALDISGLQSITLQAGDRIASATSLSLDAVNLTNAGELLSDGDLTLKLSGNLNNQGLISTQQTLSVEAANVTQDGGRIASAGDAALTISGTLDNLGRLTSSTNLTVSADRIVNRGTLGAQQLLKLTAIKDIDNQQDSLIFAGADMALRSDSLFNKYADIYSAGNFSFSAVDGTRAALLSNLSASIESAGDIDIKTKELDNSKAEFEASQRAASRRIVRDCTDCSGDTHSGYFIVRTTYEGSVTKDSQASRLLANRDLLLDAVTVTNGQSLLAANRDASITATDFTNRGFTLDNRNERVNYYLSGVSQADYRVTESAANRWNDKNEGRPVESQAAIPTEVTQYGIRSTTNTILPGNGTTYTGTVQAGRTLKLNISNELINGSLTDQGNAQLTGATLNSATSGPGGRQVILGTPVGSPGPLKDVTRVETTAADGSVQVSFVPVDFSGAPFVSVDPTSLSSFRLPQGDYGLFTQSRNPAGQYLIESNPSLTDTDKFMSSDYLLSNLGYDPVEADRRLGDGRYETRLIADAVRVQTGQRFLADGLSSDYEQFQYLMDNAVASKDALGLSVGVGLTSEQVAALTHDIVWMEERVVEGETVLTPVLYLASVDSRNLRGGSLIQGRTVEMITGGDLKNVGTLRASEDLTVLSGGSIYQGGLTQANDNLTLLAANSIRNALAGEIRGDKVSLTTLTGDITNDRTAVKFNIGADSKTQLDAGSSITAGSQLDLNAANDLTNKGQISSGGDATLTAGNDINLLAVQDRTVDKTALRRGMRTEETITQLGSSVTAAGNLTLKAGNDINALASKASAGQDLAVEAGGDVNLISAADEHNLESRFKKGNKKVHEIDNQSRQVASEFTAGRNLDVDAKGDVTLQASNLKAGDEAYIYAGNNLNLVAAQNSDYSLYDMEKKGSWGSKATRRDEVTQITHVGSKITTGGDLTLQSGGDQLYQVAKLNSGADLTIDSGGSITFEGVKDLHDESHTKSDDDAFWTSSKGKGNTDETLRQTQMVAAGNITIKAVDGLKIDIKDVNQQSVSQTIDAMVQADPQLAWLKDAEKRGDVDWRQVKEIHESFKYSTSGLGPASQLIIAILMSVMLGPAGAGLGGAALAGASSLATTAAVATINNGGDLGAGLKAITSKDGLTDAAIAAITADVAQNYLGDMTMTKTVNGKIVIDLGSIEAVSHFAGQQLINNASAAVIAKAFGRDVTLAGILQSTIYSTLAAYSFDQVGSLGLKTGSPEKIALHALVGGMIAEASGSDFAVGALAAGVNEAFANQLRRISTQIDPENRDRLMIMASQLLGIVAAAAVDGDNADSLQIGSSVAADATQYNNLNHYDMSDFVDDMNFCTGDEGCQRKFWIGGGYEEISKNISDWADNAVSGAVAKSMLGQIQGGLTDLQALSCTTPTCTEFKDLLINRAMEDLTNLAKVTGMWEHATSVAALVVPLSGGSSGVSASVGASLDRFWLAKAESTGAAVGGKSCVYSCVIDGVTRYVGITDDILKRGQAHLREKDIVITKIRGLDNISRSDARAVEQTLIDYYGLGKNGGTLINKINSISAVKNPTKYEQALIRGAELLKKAGYEGF